MSVGMPNWNSYEEERFLLLGMSVHSKLLLVCHCERQGGEVIRIISARKATKRESAFCRGDVPPDLSST